MSGNNDNTIWGIPTQIDFANSMVFAQQQIAKMKCEDPDIIKSVCEGTGPGGAYAGGGKCIEWQEDLSQQTFPKPANYFIKQCKNDNDCKWGNSQMGYCDLLRGQCTCSKDNSCGQGMECLPDPKNPAFPICGWEPDTHAGHCIFNNETACEAQGMLPYTCDYKGYCNQTDKSNKSAYTEWHIDSDGKQQCQIGNFALRLWCENPGSRCQPDSSGKYPDSCKESDDAPRS